MTTFEVTIEMRQEPGQDGEPVAEAKSLRLLVAAEHWVDAWQEGLAVMGDAPNPRDASCVLDDATAHVEVPSTGRLFVIRPLLRSPVAHAHPTPGHPVLLAGHDDGPAIRVQSRIATATPRGGLGGVTHGDRMDLGAHVPSTRRGRSNDLTISDLDADDRDDPVARVLSDLERQRLGARPMRIDASGLPQPIDARNRRRPTPHAVPRAVHVAGLVRGAVPPEPDERRLRTRDDTRAFTPALVGPLESLPQQFRPVSATGAIDSAAPGDRLSALQWAVDTAWQHVPCAVVLLLDDLASEAPEVAFARGERERETRGCRVPFEHAFRQVACRAPTRVRFADRAQVRFVRADEQTFDLEVSSSLCAPVAFVPGHATPSTFGLGLVLLNSTRASGFTDSELRALTYLSRTLAERLDGL